MITKLGTENRIYYTHTNLHKPHSWLLNVVIYWPFIEETTGFIFLQLYFLISEKGFVVTRWLCYDFPLKGSTSLNLLMNSIQKEVKCHNYLYLKDSHRMDVWRIVDF